MSHSRHHGVLQIWSVCVCVFENIYVDVFRWQQPISRGSIYRPQDSTGTVSVTITLLLCGCVCKTYFPHVSFVYLQYFRGPDLDMDWEKKKGKLYTYFTFGVCCSEVELDCLTGEYRV